MRTYQVTAEQRDHTGAIIIDRWVAATNKKNAEIKGANQCFMGTPHDRTKFTITVTEIICECCKVNAGTWWIFYTSPTNQRLTTCSQCFYDALDKNLSQTVRTIVSGFY